MTLIQHIENLKKKLSPSHSRIAFVEPEDPRIQEASLRILENGFLGKIYWIGSNQDSKMKGIEFIKIKSDDTPQSRLSVAADLLKNQSVDAVLAGAIYKTADVVRSALKDLGLAEGLKTLSSSFAMIRDQELLVFADCGVVISPTLEQHIDIALASAQTYEALTGESARLAFLSFSTHQSAHHELAQHMATVTQTFRSRYPNILCDGELQWDAAYVPEVAAIKAPLSPVAGRANVFIFPDLNSGNIAYKLTQRLAGYLAVGPLLQGCQYVLSDLSRGATVEDIEASVYVNLARAQLHQP